MDSSQAKDRRAVPRWWQRVRRYITWKRGLLAAGAAVVAYIAYALITLPPVPSSLIDPTRPSTVYDADGNAVGPLSGDVMRIPVGMKEMAEYLPKAFVASEDVRFYQHHGIDPKGIGRALLTDLRSGSIQEGGSTITQQVAKNTFLDPRQTVRRKIQEVVLSLELEHRYAKDEILTMYLNQIYEGKGAYGVGAAAKIYFNKRVSDLTLGECATLAGMTPGPESFNPISYPDEALQRRNLVLDRMVAAGYLDAAQAEKEKAKPLSVHPGTVTLKNPYPWYMDAVRSELESRYGLNERMVDVMGLKIYTGINPAAQQAAERALAAKIFPASAPDGLEGALAAVDPRSGEVRALVGGRDYVPGGLNRAMYAQVSPGSSIKPVLVYGPAFEYAGLTPESTVSDTPLNIEGWEPQNFDKQFHGDVTVREAARESMNIPAIRMLQQVGLPKAKSFAEGLGIPFAKGDQSLMLALGSMAQGVSPLQLASAYQGFANGGTYYEPHLIVRIEAADGVVPPVKTLKPHKGMSAKTAYQVTDILKTVVRAGTGTLALLGDRPMAGKTGTVELPATPDFQGKEGNSAAWFVGYTPDLVAAVWVGYDQIDAGHFLPPDVNGSTYPTRIWRQMASAALAGRPYLNFPDVAGRAAAVPKAAAPAPAPTAPAPAPAPVALPAVTGLVATPGAQAGSVALAWQAAQVANPPTGLVFRVVRGTEPNVPLDDAHTISTEKGTTLTDKPDATGTYYYRVAALDPATGKQGEPSPEVRITVYVPSPTTPPSTPGTPEAPGTPGTTPPGTTPPGTTPPGGPTTPPVTPPPTGGAP